MVRSMVASMTAGAESNMATFCHTGSWGKWTPSGGNNPYLMYLLQQGCMSLRFHKLSKQCHQPGTECSMKWAYCGEVLNQTTSPHSKHHRLVLWGKEEPITADGSANWCNPYESQHGGFCRKLNVKCKTYDPGFPRLAARQKELNSAPHGDIQTPTSIAVLFTIIKTRSLPSCP